MPRVEEKPPTKRVDELVTEITGEMWADFDLDESQNVRDDRIVSFLIRKLAYLQADNELLRNAINEIP